MTALVRMVPLPIMLLFSTLLSPAAEAQDLGAEALSREEVTTHSSEAVATSALERLEAELARIGPLSGGTLGIHAVHLETGRSVGLNSDETFPMASTYKVPMAYQLLRRVDAGQVRLDSLVYLEPHHFSPGSGTLSDLFIQPGVALSVRNLLELMLLISDNTATDLVLEIAGGPEAVSTAMVDGGFAGVRVDRSTLRLIADWIGVEGVEEGPGHNLERFRELSDAISDEARTRAGEAFATDPRDTATPQSMAALLAAIWRDEGLSAESAALLRDIMDRCRTGEGRIRGLLPEFVNTANKTGTIGGSLNDVGAIELPDGGGTVVVAAFIRDSDQPNPRREAALAGAVRAIYDYFLFNP